MRLDYIEHGDCFQLMPNIPDKSINLIVGDLPYGLTNAEWDKKLPLEPLWEHYNRVIKDNGVIVLFGMEPYSSELRLSNINAYKYDWIWNKHKASNFLNAKKRPLQVHETISVFYKDFGTYNPQKKTGQRKKHSFRKAESQCELYNKTSKSNLYDSSERYPNSILDFSTDTQKSALVTTQKPLALYEFLIRTYTNRGDVVLDNCMGSGTTCVACINTERHYIGFELKEDRFTIADTRIQKAIKEKKEKDAQLTILDCSDFSNFKESDIKQLKMLGF